MSKIITQTLAEKVANFRLPPPADQRSVHVAAVLGSPHNSEQMTKVCKEILARLGP